MQEGGSVIGTVRLAARPYGAVTVNLTVWDTSSTIGYVSDEGLARLDRSSFTFVGNDWNVQQ